MPDRFPSVYAKPRSWLGRRLFQSPVLALLSHWLLQSLLYMDPAERHFKLGLDLLLTVFCALLLKQWVPDRIAWPAAFLVAHSTNFFFNGQLWGVLKCYDLVRWERPRFEAYVAGMAERARGEPAIQALIAYGSLARAEWNPASDLDARIIRAPGWLNGLRACLFLICERTRALAARFPLDVYVIDSLDTLGRLRRDEIGIDLIRWVESGEFPVNRRRSDDGW